jgi:predicted RNase H-like nuclease
VVGFLYAREDASVDDDRVLGVDACKPGWVGLALAGSEVTAYFAVTIDELVASVDADGPPAVVAIDIPIGLADRDHRKADQQARKAVGVLWSAVFMTPVRSALNATDHQTASNRNRELTGSGISIQAFSLKPKLQQVEHWIRRGDRRVIEVHPEVSFAELAGHPLTTRKSSWAGAEQRRCLLATAGILLAGDLRKAGRYAAVDDILDAAAAVWTARRFARGQAICRPDPPEVFSDGLSCAIWS